MCQHHWIIDSANYGKCRKCGEVRQFPMGYEGWFDKGVGGPAEKGFKKDFDSPTTTLVFGYEKEKPKE